MGKKFGNAGLYNYLKPLFFQKRKPTILSFCNYSDELNRSNQSKNIFYVFDQTAKYEKIFLSKEIDAIISL